MAAGKRQVSFLIGIFFLIFLFILIAIAVISVISLGNRLPLIGRAAVAVVEIKGTIFDTNEQIEKIEKYAANPFVKAIVLRIESPGGAVAASQELYREIRKIRKQSRKPIVASMGNVAASGGYYVACAADEIYANPGTVTGSIGVIFQAYNIEGISKKLGIGVNIVKSGKFKDTGSPFRQMTPEERKILQGAIDDTYDQFLEAVLAARREALAKAYLRNSKPTSPTLATGPAVQSTTGGLETAQPDPGKVPREKVKAYLRSFADGRVLSGRQALGLGLVDHLGDLRDATDRAARLAGIRGKPTVLREKRKPTIWDLFGSRTGIASRLGLRQGVSLEYRLSFD